MNGALHCSLELRREQVRQAPLLGLDCVEVDETQTMLEVFFLGRAPAELTTANVVISGGAPVRVTAIRVYRQRDTTLDDWMRVDVDRPGDFSTYTLSLVQPGVDGKPEPMTGFDPLYAAVSFSFKASCPTYADCLAQTVCPPPARPAPPIDYLAKDYASFRQLILDRLAQTIPGWTETHVPDIGVMLVDLLAYVGDQLSYYQDAVATEAYLGTARQRISLRRHARLVDYRVHEGCNARAWVTIATDLAQYTLDLSGVSFCTSLPGGPAPGILPPAELAKAPAGSYTVFEPLWPAQTITLLQAHNEIRFYTWGDCACCLPTDTTCATLADFAPGGTTRVLALRAGDILIFEEVIGPHTGDPADADPTHRQAVRLTEVTPDADRLFNRDAGGLPVLRIAWCAEDALRFPLCLSAVMPAPDCTCRDGISVARGNVLLVDQGMHTTQGLGTVPIVSSTPTCATDCAPSTVVLKAGPYRPALPQAPLTHAQPLPPCICATPVVTQDVRQALPWISLTGTVAGPGGTIVTTWTPLPDLLESGPDDAVFVVETNDSGIAHLRFGNGDEGRQPEAGAVFSATYRIGNGPAGNVGHDTINYIVLDGTGSLVPRNPLPATGGTAPESAEDIRMLAPHAFRDVLERAITAADYATLARDNARRLAERVRLERPPVTPSPALPRQAQEEEPGAPIPLPADLCLIPFEPLQNARGTLRWNGSWYEVVVAVDPMGTETADAELLAEIDAYLTRYRRIGHDVSVTPASYVALDLGLSICVKPLYLQAQVAALLRRVLGTGVLPDGTLALFNPNRLTFGQSVYLSPIVAAAQSIPGVLEVQVTRLARLVLGRAPPRSKPDSVPAHGMLSLGPSEIARLDQNPNAPEDGRLTLLLRGGR